MRGLLVLVLLGTRLATGGGGAYSATVSAGYDGRVDGAVAGWGPSFEYWEHWVLDRSPRWKPGTGSPD